MSTLVNLLLATVVSLLGGDLKKEQNLTTSTVEIIYCEEKTDSLANYYNITDDLKFKSNEI